MIPHIIHYCWFGGKELPPLAKKCIASWKRYFPGYEIKCWTEADFDVNISRYTKEAYQAGLYAFVSDYARFWILYQEGGVYFDVDVEVIRPMDDILAQGSFMGMEDPTACNPGLGMAAIPHAPFIGKCLDFYNQMSFLRPDGSVNYDTIVKHTTDLLRMEGMVETTCIQSVAGFTLYPKAYFCPFDYKTNVLDITSNTRSIHHYNASWIKTKHRLYVWVKKHFGSSVASFFSSIYKLLRK